MIAVVVLRVGLGPEAQMIEPMLAAMQGIVGGFLEQVMLTFLPTGVVCYVDEDGHSKGLPLNRWGLLGTILVVRVQGTHEVNLTKDDISAIKRLTTKDKN